MPTPIRPVVLADSRSTCTDAVIEAYARMQASKDLNAVCFTREPEARAEAARLDREPIRGPLHGMPILVKDSLDLIGAPTTFGLPARKDHRATADDPVVARLKAAGAVVLGKTNVSQALLYYESDNPVYGRTLHPMDATRTPGGSSGGLSAAVAAGIVRSGVGSDLGGSCRIPAAFCGVVGFKPSADRLPDRGDGSLPLGG